MDYMTQDIVDALNKQALAARKEKLESATEGWGWKLVQPIAGLFSERAAKPVKAMAGILQCFSIVSTVIVSANQLSLMDNKEEEAPQRDVSKSGISISTLGQRPS